MKNNNVNKTKVIFTVFIIILFAKIECKSQDTLCNCYKVKDKYIDFKGNNCNGIVSCSSPDFNDIYTDLFLFKEGILNKKIVLYTSNGNIFFIENYNKNRTISDSVIIYYSSSHEVIQQNEYDTDSGYLKKITNFNQRTLSKDNSIHSIEFFDKGKRTQSLVFYPTGELNAIIKYEENKIKQITEYFKNGQLGFNCSYIDELHPVGKGIWYDENGKITKYIIYNKDGKRILEEKEYPSHKNRPITSF